MTIHCRASGSGTATAVGTLIIGDANSQTGFNFDGAPAVGTNQVVLADSNPADLGSVPTIGLGSQLNSLNGIRIAANRAIATSAHISATIGSKLTDNGTDGGPTLDGQFLSLTGDLTGTGNFGGKTANAGTLSVIPEPSALGVCLAATAWWAGIYRSRPNRERFSFPRCLPDVPKSFSGN